MRALGENLDTAAASPLARIDRAGLRRERGLITFPPFMNVARPVGFLALLFSALWVSPGVAADKSLANSTSAFVRAQAGSKVAWQAWDSDWAERAKAENKPVFLFVGSFLSELTQAMCRQSFASAQTADYLNQHFICVLIDREERPDIAASAHFYLSIVKQGAGWPVNLWLTPELQPYEGGGYLPPSEEWGKAGFSKVVRQAAEAWKEKPGACRNQAREGLAMMKAAAASDAPAIAPGELEKKLAAATAAWRETADPNAGGFGTAPKMPEPELLRFLLRGLPADREMALTALRALRDGAVRDPVDGGFFRYATDAAWRVPYLQRTVLDQARIALAFLDAHALTHDETFASVARSTLEFALSHFGNADGSFAAAEDGTAEANAGYFTWTNAEIDAVLGKDAEAFKRAYGVKPEGNVSPDEDPAGIFHGKNFLFHAGGADPAFDAALSRLRAARDRRPALPGDDRATAVAHGWMIAALARASTELKDPRYLKLANRSFEWTRINLVATKDGHLRRWRDGGRASPLDYAAFAFGCREIARAGHPYSDDIGHVLLERADEQFFDPAQGIFLCASAEPSPGVFFRAPAADNSVEAEGLALTGSWLKRAAALEKTVAATLIPGTTSPGDVLLALRLNAGK